MEEDDGELSGEEVIEEVGQGKVKGMCLGTGYVSNSVRYC